MKDLRFAIGTLWATPIVSFVAILSLTLGIGANTAIFSVVDSLLLGALPVKEPQQLVQLAEASADGQRSWTYPIWDQIHQRPQLFDRAFAWSNNRFNLAAGGETEFVDARRVECRLPFLITPTLRTRTSSPGRCRRRIACRRPHS